MLHLAQVTHSLFSLLQLSTDRHSSTGCCSNGPSSGAAKFQFSIARRPEHLHFGYVQAIAKQNQTQSIRYRSEVTIHFVI